VAIAAQGPEKRAPVRTVSQAKVTGAYLNFGCSSVVVDLNLFRIASMNAMLFFSHSCNKTGNAPVSLQSHQSQSNRKKSGTNSV
jgi:hypothetical protein